MKKLLIGLVLCAGMAQGQIIQNCTGNYTSSNSDKQYMLAGDTVRIYVQFQNPNGSWNNYLPDGDFQINIKIQPKYTWLADTSFSRSTYSVDNSSNRDPRTGRTDFNWFIYYFIIPKNFTTSVYGVFLRNSEPCVAFNVLNEPTGIEDSYLNESESKVVAFYDVQGRRVERAIEGKLLIVEYADGIRKKLVYNQ